MHNKKDILDEDHHMIKTAVFVALAILLVVVFGKFTTGAFSYIADNSEGKSYDISGQCDFEEDSADCCEDSCVRWCAAKEKRLIGFGVKDSKDIKCECTCSF